MSVLYRGETEFRLSFTRTYLLRPLATQPAKRGTHFQEVARGAWPQSDLPMGSRDARAILQRSSLQVLNLSAFVGISELANGSNDSRAGVVALFK